MKSHNTWIIAIGLMVTTLSVRADLIFDRGLPTANLNVTAGANRANVAWADSETTGSPTEYYVPGDNFTLGGSGSYQVNTIRVWTTGSTTGLSLLGGLDSGSSMGSVSTSYTATPVSYTDSSSYQPTVGPFVQIYQIDFAVTLLLSAGATYDFFLNSPFTSTGSDFVDSTLHSSNAGLSGSTQEGADDTFLWLHVNGLAQDVETWGSGDNHGTSDFGVSWDKNSDANVQVFGTVSSVPEPGSLALVSSALLLLPFSKTLRQKWQKRSNA